MAENTSFSTLTTKQKVIGILTLAIFAFIIYEVIGLFSSGSNKPATTITPAPTPSPQAKQMKMPNGGPQAQAPAVATQAAYTSTLPTVNAIAAPKEPLDVKQQQQQQEVYLDSVNQLQLLKVKRDIAETNQAIATARLATETANKNMSDLLTQPTLPQGPPATYSNKLSMQTSGNDVSAAEPTQIKAPPVVETPFVVISVSMQFNRWSAVLNSQGKMYSVSIGDTLFDGSTVTSINKNGVVLTRDGKRRRITLQTTI